LGEIEIHDVGLADGRRPGPPVTVMAAAPLALFVRRRRYRQRSSVPLTIAA
jgi:hypothetical protein